MAAGHTCQPRQTRRPVCVEKLYHIFYPVGKLTVRTGVCYAQSVMPASNHKIIVISPKDGTARTTKKTELSLYLENLPDGLLLFTNENHLLFINRAARHLLGIKKEVPVAYEVNGLLERRFDFRSRLEESLNLGHPVRLDTVTVGDFILRIIIVPVKESEASRPLGVVVVLSDRTAERLAEKMREDFTAMMVHELRAPLTTVHGASDTLLKDFNIMKKEDIETSLRLIRGSSSSMLSLVNDLLDVAKLESGKFEVIKEEADLRPLLREQVDSFRPLAREKSLTLELVMPESLPKLSFDVVRLEDVLNNLLSNAIKFTKRGGISISVKLGEGEVVVAVKDSGRGIPPEEISQLFSKYKQLKQPPSLEEQRGTGLGLVIVKGIVEAHGGRTWVKSRVGEGSTFYFSLPL